MQRLGARLVVVLGSTLISFSMLIPVSVNAAVIQIDSTEFTLNIEAVSRAKGKTEHRVTLRNVSTSDMEKLKKLEDTNCRIGDTLHQRKNMEFDNRF